MKRLISLIRRSIETPQLRVVSSRMSILGPFESLRSDRDTDPAVPVAEELKPQQGPLDRGATADFCRLTRSFRRCSMYCVMLSMTRCPARSLRT